jgi:hypothetical protein
MMNVQYQFTAFTMMNEFLSLHASCFVQLHKYNTRMNIAPQLKCSFAAMLKLYPYHTLLHGLQKK